ncbi:MAG: TetR/AcrR family transcriptional regulator [Emcibacter sp.]|nr:TetR/AcrR family transcriptional regulator [Emcibacter sp.]
MGKERGDRPVNYSSPAIRDRRRRILEEARKIISEKGLSEFSMGELCVRAGVAKRTLYNAFQSKELIISAAINEYFEVYVEKIPYKAPDDSMYRIVERMAWIFGRNLKIRNYIRALMAIYFSPEVNSDIWEALHMLGFEFSMQWISRLKSKKQLQPWVNGEQLAHDIIRLEYGIINDWCQGRITDEDFVNHTLFCYLTFVAGATRGQARKEIEDMLRKLHEGSLLDNI